VEQTAGGGEDLDGGTPGKLGGEGWVQQLQGTKGELLVGSVWAEEGCRDGSTAASSSPGLQEKWRWRSGV
jgi:hypothetical protein